MTRETPVGLKFGDEELESVLVARRDHARRPGIILFTTVMGVSDLELGFARQLVHLGYTGFVADLFGKAFRGAPRDVMMDELKRLRSDRASLRERLLAVLESARGQEAIEPDRIVAIGYCFGGQCALDLARSGADIAGVALTNLPSNRDPQLPVVIDGVSKRRNVCTGCLRTMVKTS